MSADKSKAMERAERRVERARAGLAAAHRVLFDMQGAYLAANGWERVWCWPPRDRLWKRGDRVYTTFGAMREQEQIEKRRARDRANRARKAAK